MGLSTDPHDYRYFLNAALDRMGIDRTTEAKAFFQHFLDHWGELNETTLLQIHQEGNEDNKRSPL